MRRLYSRIYLHFLGVLLAVGIATTGVFVVGSRGEFVREMMERVERHIGALVEADLANPRALDHRLRELHDNLGLDLTVRSADGQVLAVAGRELPPLTSDEAQAVLGGRMPPHHRGRPSYSAVPLHDAAGHIHGALQASPQPHFRSPRIVRQVLAVLVALFIVGVATRPLARRISRPVERLTEAARRVGGGDLSYRIPMAACQPEDWGFAWRGERLRGRFRRKRREGRYDELGELTKAFNDMAERVERLVRGQKELLANVSHELRSPLARIRMALELLPREPGDEARFRDVETDLIELDRLIEDVLTTSRLDATGLPTHLGSVEVRPLLERIAERAGIDPVTAGKAVLVQSGGEITVNADGGLLKRALWNLVENAAKYGAPPITLAAEEKQTTTGQGAPAISEVVLSVSDEGEGIPIESRERVFSAFVRLDKARTPRAAGEPTRGFGLGLTLARKVAEVHGGSIRIDAAHVEEGRERGCRITITIPQKP